MDNLPVSTPLFSPSEMEDSACPVCGNSGRFQWEAEDKVFGKPGSFKILECASCGHHWVSPRPKEAVIWKAYESRQDMNRGHLSQRDTFLRAQEGRLQILASMVPPGSRLLDVGSGNGLFLYAAKRAGYTVLGFEPDEDSRRYQLTDLNVLSLPPGPGDQPNWPLADQSLDAVTFWASLECAHFPMIWLQEARRVLKPGGAVIICVPNYRSWERKFFKSSWFGLQPQVHLSHFSPASLKTALQKSGFELGPVWCASTATGVTMSWRAKRGRPLDQPGEKRGEIRWFFKKIWLKSLLHPFLKFADYLGFGGTMLALARKPEA